MDKHAVTRRKWLAATAVGLGGAVLSNGVMDVGFEAVDWTREWIQKVGDTSL